MAERDANIFDIDDAFLYFPSSNLNYQGEVHFRSRNPNPAATFRYYVKDGYETLKQKRVKAQKKAEKDETPYPYPTEEELLAERQESKPALIFTIYDSEDNVMRKINAPLRKGYNSVNWDLAYLNASGPKAPPGNYKVALDKNIKGEFTRLVDPKPFVIFSIPNALGSPNYADNFNYKKQIVDLNAKVASARGKINDMNTRLKNMKTILSNMPVEADFMVTKIDSVQDQINDVSKIILGGFGAKNSVSSRLRFALFASMSAQVDVTGSQKEQYEIAQDAYNSQEVILNTLYDDTLPGLEQEFQDAGGQLFNLPPRRRFFEDKN